MWVQAKMSTEGGKEKGREGKGGGGGGGGGGTEMCTWWCYAT